MTRMDSIPGKTNLEKNLPKLIVVSLLGSTYSLCRDFPSFRPGNCCGSHCFNYVSLRNIYQVTKTTGIKKISSTLNVKFIDKCVF